MRVCILKTSFLGLMSLACLTHQAGNAQQLFKCKDERGQITFSDTGCKLSPKEKARRPVPTVESLSKASKGDVAMLTPTNVEAMLQKANDLTGRGDYRAQCAMLAPDLLFNITDRSSNPPVTMAGGKQKMCAYTQQSEEMLRASGVSTSGKLGKLAIKVGEDGQTAKVNYTSIQTMSARGMPTLTIRCVQEDGVGIYNGNILFNRSSATCDPESLK